MGCNREISIGAAPLGFAIAIGNGFAIKRWPSDLAGRSTVKNESEDHNRSTGESTCDQSEGICDWRRTIGSTLKWTAEIKSADRNRRLPQAMPYGKTPGLMRYAIVTSSIAISHQSFTKARLTRPDGYINRIS